MSLGIKNSVVNALDCAMSSLQILIKMNSFREPILFPFNILKRITNELHLQNISDKHI